MAGSHVIRNLVMIAIFVAAIIFIPSLRRRTIQVLGITFFMTLSLVNATTLFPLVTTTAIVLGLGAALILEVVMRVIGLGRVRPMDRIMNWTRWVFWSYARPVFNSLMVMGTDKRHPASRTLPNWDELLLSAGAILGTFCGLFYLKMVSDNFFAQLGFKPLTLTFQELHLAISISPFWVLDFMFFGFPLLLVTVVYLKLTKAKGFYATRVPALVVNKKATQTGTHPVVKTTTNKSQKTAINGQVVQGAQVVLQNGQYVVVLPLMGQAVVGQSFNGNSVSMNGVKSRDDRQTIQDWLDAERAGKENYWQWGIAPVQGRQKTVTGAELDSVVMKANGMSGLVKVTVFNAAKTDKVYFQTEIEMGDLKVEAQS